MMNFALKMELLDTEGTGDSRPVVPIEGEIRLVRVAVNKLEKAKFKETEIVEMEEELEQKVLALNIRIKEAEKNKVAGSVATTYALANDLPDPEIAWMEETMRREGDIGAMKESIIDTNVEIRVLQRGDALMEVACAYKWHEEEYEEPAATEHEKIRAGWILSREGVRQRTMFLKHLCSFVHKCLTDFHRW